jgi:predicted molibdopterin-dependent oxidoreductase YjgC
MPKSDFEIFVDYARRMEFKNKDGEDLLPFKTQEEAFNHWARSTKGRPCDYTGMTYAKLTGGSGIQWPCNEQYPKGRPRLVRIPNKGGPIKANTVAMIVR